MRELRRTILRMRDVNRRIADAIVRTDHGRGQVIVGLRLQFSQECGEFLNQLLRIPLHPGETAVFDELQEKYEGMQTRLRQHQRRWSPREISADRSRYLSASKIMSADIDGFVRECLELIADGRNDPPTQQMPHAPGRAA